MCRRGKTLHASTPFLQEGLITLTVSPGSCREVILFWFGEAFLHANAPRTTTLFKSSSLSGSFPSASRPRSIGAPFVNCPGTFFYMPSIQPVSFCLGYLFPYQVSFSQANRPIILNHNSSSQCFACLSNYLGSLICHSTLLLNQRMIPVHKTKHTGFSTAEARRS